MERRSVFKVAAGFFLAIFSKLFSADVTFGEELSAPTRRKTQLGIIDNWKIHSVSPSPAGQGAGTVAYAVPTASAASPAQFVIDFKTKLSRGQRRQMAEQIRQAEAQSPGHRWSIVGDIQQMAGGVGIIVNRIDRVDVTKL
jgi:hypothetical protein